MRRIYNEKEKFISFQITAKPQLRNKMISILNWHAKSNRQLRTSYSKTCNIGINTLTSKEGLNSLSLDRNLDGVSRCSDGSFCNGLPCAGGLGFLPIWCEITVWKAILWNRFISSGVTTVLVPVSKTLLGRSGVFEDASSVLSGWFGKLSSLS